MQSRLFFVSIAIAILLIVSGAFAFALMAAPGAVSSSNARASVTATTVASQIAPSTHTSTATNSAASNGNLIKSASSPTPASTSSYISAAQAAHVPLKYVYVPAAPSKPHFQNGYVSPGYLQSPAPIGIGAYGIMNSSGTLVPYSYTSNGFSATINATTMNPFDVNSYDPNGMTMQLNTVLTDTSVMGVTGYTYWTQNVLFYDSYSHQFEMVDNIWNFSSPTSLMPPGTIASHTAFQQPYSAAYIGVGPVINNVSAPFVATLTLESTVIGGYDTVFFNYTLNFTNSSTLLRQSIGGVFDEVMFNSPSGVLGYVPPMPVFRVDGGSVTPTGYIPYDAEITLGGPGGGSHINLASINATMQLTYMDSSGNYVNVPSAYNIGSETGETASGAAVAWQPSGLATFTSGPSLVEGMWNISSYTGMTHYTGTIAPSNGFMFVSPGSSIALDAYGYVPMTTSGDYSFWLPTGTYYQEVLMSYHTPEAGSLSATESITLAADATTGVYTPLYAMDNAQVANISMSGAGTITSPYLLYNNQTGYLNGLFGNFNDFGFPLFSGMQIANTNVYVDSNNTPSFEIMYNGAQVLFYMSFYEVPSIDYLGIVLYNTSNLSIYNANMITGTIIADFEAGFYGANLMMWNCTNDLIANSTFVPSPYYPYAISLLIYNPATEFSNNTIYGNYFLGGAFGYSIYGDLAIGMDSSGNLVFNNYLDNAYNVFDGFGDLYTGAPTLYLNTYNISATPTSAFSMSVNGYTLMGNILGNDTMGGNYWNDYISGVYALPFNEFGDIAIGGDYLPIVLQTALYFPVVFEQTGLSIGHSWSVTMGGVTKTSTGSMLMFEAMIGQYNYTVSTTGNYIYFDYNGGVAVVNSYGISQDIGFLFIPYTLVTVNEQGLPAGYGWGADTVVNGAYTTSTSVTFAAVPGMWQLSYYLDGSDYYYFPNFYSYAGGGGLIIIGSSPVTVDVTFAPILNAFTLYAYGAGPTDTWSYTAWMFLNDGSLVNMGTFQGTGASTTAMLPYAEYYFTFSSSSLVVVGYGPGPYGVIQFGPPGYYTQGSSFGIDVTTGTTLTLTIPNLPAGVTWQVSAYANYYYWDNFSVVSGNSITLMVPQDAIYYDIAFSNADYMEQTGYVYVSSPMTVLVPLVMTPTTQVSVTFSESGIASGTSWQVTLNGQTQSSTSSSITFTTNPGQEYYQVYSNGSMSPQSSGLLNVQGPMTVDIQFYALPAPTYTITFVAAGLPSGQSWSVTFNGQTKSTSNGAAVFTVTAGTYSYAVANISGYTLSTNSSTVSVGSNTIMMLQFQAVKTTPTTPSSTANYLMYAGLLAIGLVVGGLVGFALLRFTGKKKQ